MPSAGLPSKSVTVDVVAGDRDDLVLAELQRLAGVLDEGGDVGADEVLALAEADDQRRVAAGGHHPGRVLGVDGDEREGTLEPPADGLHGGGQVGAALTSLGSSRCAATSVSVSETQLVAGGLELVAQPGEVLDDAVVHERHPAGPARGAGAR